MTPTAATAASPPKLSLVLAFADKGLRVAPHSNEGTLVRIPQRQAANQENILAKIINDNLQSHIGYRVLDGLVHLSQWVSSKSTPDYYGENAKHFVALGGHGILLVAMRKWKEDAAIQSSCCECIARLLYGYPTTPAKSKQLTEPLLELGVVPLVFGALERFPDSPTLQYRANNVLQYLDMKRIVQDFDGVNMVLKIMKKFPKEAQLQELGCRFFQTNLQLGFISAAVIRKRAIVVIVEALKSHPNHKGIRQSVAIILKRVSGSIG